VTPAIAVTGMAANSGINAFDGLPEYLQIESLPQVSTIYAKQGGKDVPIATFYSQNRVEVSSDDIAQVMKDATIATEDPRFYQHGGIDVEGTARAVILTQLLHKSTSGGSSITQQYVKNVKVQKCEKLNKVVTNADAEKQKKLQAAQDKKYRSCYKDATETTISRKMEEIKQAIGLEKKYSKNEILNGYLNIAGFGGSVYGVESAARYYFGATAKTLTLTQAATLVAILNNPANLRIDQDKSVNKANNADNGFARTLERRNYVLKRMLTNGKITQQQYDEAVKTKIEPKITPQPNGCETAAQYQAAYYCDWVQHLIAEDTGLAKTADDRDALLRAGGLKIYTPLNLDLQAVAQSSLSTVVPSAMPGVALGGTNVAVELNTGRVITMVQNTKYTASASDDPNYTGINYNTDYDQGGSGGFQTGSTYKAFTLLEWLKEGRSINDYVTAPSAATTLPASRWHTTCPDKAPTATWTVGNDGPGEGGTMSVTSATAASVNTAFAVMGTKLDLCGIRQTALDMGIHPASPYTWDYDTGKEVPNELQGSPATILGTNDLSPLTLATAYAGIANGGKWCTPIGIDKILDASGKELPVTKTTCTQGVDPNVAAGATKALEAVLHGTGYLANPNDGVPIMGKTGTTDEAAQNWFVSSTTKVATATWVGQTKQTNGSWINFGGLYLNGYYGRDAKLYVAKPIIAAINGLYGGDNFPEPTGSVLKSKQISVPDLSGKSPDDAKSTLEGLGLEYADGGQVDSSQPAGTVASTNPAAGSTAGIGEAVTVYTSKGNLSQVPDVHGKKASDAISTLTSAGFNVKYNGDSDATVTATDPPAGSEEKSGTTITLKVQAKTTGGGHNDQDGGDG
jgi:membrane peptidoglycan carboxypeptidase